MHAFERHSTSRLGALIVTALFAVGLLSGRARAEDFSKSYSVTNRPHVRVLTNDGAVRVSTGESKQVEFRVEYEGYEINKTLQIESHQQGDEVELTARVIEHLHLRFGSWKSLHIEVRMPKEADILVDTGDGSIKADNVSGSVDLHSGDGSIAVSALQGTLRLRTGDGAIEGNNLEGRCEASSGDGRIRLDGRFDVLNVDSGDGSIDVTVSHGSKLDGPWKIHSGDGSVTVAVPPDMSADIDASSGDGHISSDIPVTIEGQMSRSRLRGKLNGGGQSLTVRTGDGSIRLIKS